MYAGVAPAEPSLMPWSGESWSCVQALCWKAETSVERTRDIVTSQNSAPHQARYTRDAFFTTRYDATATGLNVLLMSLAFDSLWLGKHQHASGRSPITPERTATSPVSQLRAASPWKSDSERVV